MQPVMKIKRTQSNILIILTEKRANQSHIYCTYEYVTIHLITENAEMEEVLEPVHEVAASRRTEVSEGWN